MYLLYLWCVSQTNSKMQYKNAQLYPEAQGKENM